MGMMKEFMSRNKRWLGYVFYCIILAVAFLYYRFPSDILRNYLEAKVDNLNTQLSLSIGLIKPWPPFGLRLRETEVSLKDKPATTIFGADSLFVGLELWSFFRGRSKYHFKCLAYGGNIKGYVRFERNSTGAPFNTEIELDNIQIGSYGYLKHLSGRDVDGVLSSTIYYSGQKKDLIGGTGEATLRLLDGRIDLLLPILSLESIEFDEIKADMGLKRGRISLTRLELAGPQLKSTLSGTIGLRRNLASSTLDLRGRIEPLASLFKNQQGLLNTMRLLKKGLKDGSLPFIIYGTIREPKIKFT